MITPSPSKSFWARLLSFVIIASMMVSPSAAFAVSFESNIHDGVHKIYAIDTEHFMIEFSQQILESTDSDHDGIPDLVEDLADYAETSWEAQVEDLNFPSPLDDQDKIYLITDGINRYLYEGSVGVTTFDARDEILIAIDPLLSERVMQVTVAHEFLHAIQFGYQGNFVGYEQDINFAESTAVSMEEYVYPDGDDYINYLSDYFNYPDYSILTGVIPDGTLFEYALGVWPIFLAEYLDDWEVVRYVTDAYFAEPTPDVWDAYEAYVGVLDEEYDLDIRDVYQEFALWNYVLDYYGDGDDYPYYELYISAYYGGDSYPVVDATPWDYEWPALFGTSYLQFEVDGYGGEDFQIELTKSSDIDLGVILLPESSTEYLLDESYRTILEAGNEGGVITMPVDNDYELMTVMVTPLSEDPMEVESDLDAFSVGYQYFYSADVGDYLTGNDVTVEVMAEADVAIDEDGEKEGDDPGENLPEDYVELDELTVAELAITSQDSDSITLSWTRPHADNVDGYFVYYGTESGIYDWWEVVEGAHITHATISDLWNDTFYFAVTAYTDDWEESEEYSNEVQAVVSAQTYSDVNSSHPNYYAISFFTVSGLFEGYDDGTFKPNNFINRAELMKILTYDTMIDVGVDFEDYEDCFPDVTDEWFASYVCYAKEEGWVEGYSDGYFHPEYDVTKAEALKMILESVYWEVPDYASVSGLPFEDVYGSAWYAPYVVTGYDLGILEEIGDEFEPNVARTRAEVAEEMFRLVVLSLMDVDAYNEDVLNEFIEEWGVYFF